ncbi:hypothetical protein JCM24511_01645 [Saitozyma sp. JCM 24511]|nr:hypothetical protein JCM24511_01645 [Saitozyma sp. JCM 24511]
MSNRRLASSRGGEGALWLWLDVERESFVPALGDRVAGSVDRRLEADCEMKPHGAATVPGEVVGARFTRAAGAGPCDEDPALDRARQGEREYVNGMYETRTERSRTKFKVHAQTAHQLRQSRRRAHWQRH